MRHTIKYFIAFSCALSLGFSLPASAEIVEKDIPEGYTQPVSAEKPSYAVRNAASGRWLFSTIEGMPSKNAVVEFRGTHGGQGIFTAYDGCGRLKGTYSQMDAQVRFTVIQQDGQFCGKKRTEIATAVRRVLESSPVIREAGGDYYLFVPGRGDVAKFTRK